MKTLEEKIAVMQAYLNGKEIEFKRNSGITWITYGQDGDPEFSWHLNDYRIKEAPLTKPSINWDHVNPYFKWLATDANGEAYLFSYTPHCIDDFDCGYWDFYCGYKVDASNWTSFIPGTCDWKDSLIERPSKE